MNKIVIINNWLISGGAEKQGLILAKTLSKEYKIYFCIYYPEKIEDKFLKEINENNIELILLKGNHFNKFYTFYDVCKKNGISMIISYLFAGNFMNGLVGSFLKVPYRIGGIRNSKHSSIKNLTQRFLHNHLLTLSISNSYMGIDECIKFGFDQKKMKVVHNSFEFYNEIYQKKENSYVKVITVARFVEQKDYLTSLKAIQYALSKSGNIKIHYTIIGYGKLENKIREWINEYRLTDDVTLILNPENVNEYLSQSDIYLSTSLFEGLSNSIMEGMSFSLPIVATNVGDNNQLVKEGFNGYLTETGNYKKLGDHILELSENAKKRIELGNNSYSHLRENFSHEKFRSSYLKIIKPLLAEKG
jgi:glycosyltransferase involved in cell wall biosynthesis